MPAIRGCQPSGLSATHATTMQSQQGGHQQGAAGMLPTIKGGRSMCIACIAHQGSWATGQVTLRKAPESTTKHDDRQACHPSLASARPPTIHHPPFAELLQKATARALSSSAHHNDARDTGVRERARGISLAVTARGASARSCRYAANHKGEKHVHCMHCTSGILPLAR
jgi:hypothetical protein